MNSDTEGARDVNTDIREKKIVNDLEDTEQAENSDFDSVESQTAWNNFQLASGRSGCPCLLLHSYIRCIYTEDDIGERQRVNWGDSGGSGTVRPCKAHRSWPSRYGIDEGIDIWWDGRCIEDDGDNSTIASDSSSDRDNTELSEEPIPNLFDVTDDASEYTMDPASDALLRDVTTSSFTDVTDPELILVKSWFDSAGISTLIEGPNDTKIETVLDVLAGAFLNTNLASKESVNLSMRMVLPNATDAGKEHPCLQLMEIVKMVMTHVGASSSDDAEKMAPLVQLHANDNSTGDARTPTTVKELKKALQQKDKFLSVLVSFVTSQLTLQLNTNKGFGNGIFAPYPRTLMFLAVANKASHANFDKIVLRSSILPDGDFHARSMGRWSHTINLMKATEKRLRFMDANTKGSVAEGWMSGDDWYDENPLSDLSVTQLAEEDAEIPAAARSAVAGMAD